MDSFMVSGFNQEQTIHGTLLHVAILTYTTHSNKSQVNTLFENLPEIDENRSFDGDARPSARNSPRTVPVRNRHVRGTSYGTEMPDFQC
jgi:hypothetical protein